jgi:hypothetical protein
MVVVQIKLCTTVNTMMMAVQQRGYHNMKYMQDSTKLQEENDWHKEIENLSAPLKRLFKDVSEREREISTWCLEEKGSITNNNYPIWNISRRDDGCHTRESSYARRKKIDYCWAKSIHYQSHHIQPGGTSKETTTTLSGRPSPLL